MKLLRSKVTPNLLKAAMLICVVFVLFAACNNRNIVKTTLTDTAGNVLQMEFDNCKQEQEVQ